MTVETLWAVYYHPSAAAAVVAVVAVWLLLSLAPLDADNEHEPGQSRKHKRQSKFVFRNLKYSIDKLARTYSSLELNLTVTESERSMSSFFLNSRRCRNLASTNLQVTL